jgi:hypothetical protein
LRILAAALFNHFSFANTLTDWVRSILLIFASQKAKQKQFELSAKKHFELENSFRSCCCHDTLYIADDHVQLFTWKNKCKTRIEHIKGIFVLANAKPKIIKTNLIGICCCSIILYWLSF